MQQRSEAWLLARLGKVTASRVADVLAKTKYGESERRRKYMMELIAERLTGEYKVIVPTASMRRGQEMEAIARTEYEFKSNQEVNLVGIIDHPNIEHFAASPDGLVGEAGLIEIKCPDTITHLITLQTGKIHPDYVTQVQTQLACTGRQWCDFISFDDRVPGQASFFCHRITRDNAFILELENQVREFLKDCAQTQAMIQQYQWTVEKPALEVMKSIISF